MKRSLVLGVLPGDRGLPLGGVVGRGRGAEGRSGEGGGVDSGAAGLCCVDTRSAIRSMADKTTEVDWSTALVRDWSSLLGGGPDGGGGGGGGGGRAGGGCGVKRGGLGGGW